MILLVDLLFRAFSRSAAYSVELEMPTLLAILGMRLRGPKEQKALTSRMNISPSSVTLQNEVVNVYLALMAFWLRQVPTGAQGVTLSACPAQTCLEHSILIFLTKNSL